MFNKRIEDLCNAIIAQAADDYREQYRDFIKDPQPNKVAYLLLNRRYFENDCYGMISVGAYIVEKIEEEIRTEYDAKTVLQADMVVNSYITGNRASA